MASANTNAVDTTDPFEALLANIPFASQADLEVSYGSYDEAVAAAELDGLTDEDMTFVRSPFRVITDKTEMLGVPHLIRAFRFSKDEKSERPYVVVYAVAKLPKGDEMVIYTDGSAGIMRQLVRGMERRIADGHKYPTQWYNVVNGLEKSTYDLVADKSAPNGQRPRKNDDPENVKVVGEGTTFYIG